MKLSHLQERILVELERATAETQEDLAHRIGTHQPSISRSIRSLMEAGLVSKRGENYEVTTTGQTLMQARRALEQVVASVTSDHLSEVSRQVNRQVAHVQDILAASSSVQQQLQTSFSFADKMMSQVRLGDQVGARLAQNVARPVELIRSLSQAQVRASAEWIQAYQESMQVSEAIADLIESTSTGTSEFQKRLRDMTEGLDVVRKELVASLTFADQVSRTFDQVGVFGKFWEIIEQEEAAAEAFRAAGWPIAPSMPRSVIRRVVELHEEGKTSYASQTILGHYRRGDHQNLVAMVETWRGHPLFESRMHIIDDALEAHLEGKYTLSVPTLIPQIEGVMSEYVISSGLLEELENVHNVYRTIIGDPVDQALSNWAIAKTLRYQLKNSIYYTKDFEDELARPVNRRNTTRHTITHGIMPSYDRESNSLRALLLLDAVSALTLS